MASPNTPGGSAEGIVGVLIGLAMLARAPGAGAAAPSTAAQLCGTDSVPTRLARPVSAETASVATTIGQEMTEGRSAPTVNGPMSWYSSRFALTASAWLVV